MPEHYLSVSEDFFDPGKAPLPRFVVGDIYANAPTARPPTVPALAEQPAETKPDNDRPTHTAAKDAGRRLLMSELLQLQLDELSQEVDGVRTADRDLVPYILFWLHILGDRPIAAYGREDARAFCVACSDIPHQKGMKAYDETIRTKKTSTRSRRSRIPDDQMGFFGVDSTADDGSDLFWPTRPSARDIDRIARRLALEPTPEDDD